MVAFLTTKVRKTGRSITISNCRRVGKALGSTCDNYFGSLLRLTVQIYLFHTNLLCLQELWDILCESQGEEKERNLENVCERKGRNSCFGKNPLFYLVRDFIMLPLITTYEFLIIFCHTLFCKPLSFSSPWD